jgi:hypothetical protein
MLSSLIKNKKMISVYKPIEFPVVDNEEISNEFNVVVAAREQAKKNLPRDTAKSPDFNEVDYRQKMQTKVIQASHSVQQALNDIGNSINDFSIENEINESKRLDKKYDEELASIFAEKKSELIDAKKQLELAEEDLQQFKRINKINREPNYPISSIRAISIVAIVLLVEVLINGNFFALGSDAGLMGGIFIAATVSIVNVSLGFLVGSWLFRQANSIKTKIRIYSRIGYSIIIIFAFFFNYLVALWRKALEVSPDEAEEQFWLFLNSGVSSIWDISSLGLFAVGIVCFGIAAYEGYGFDDSYPGYGKMSKQRNAIREILQEERKELAETVNIKYEEYEEWLDDKYAQIKNLKRNLSSSISSFEQQKSIFDNYVTHLEGALEYILKLYRDTNHAERSEPDPIFFDDVIDAKIPFTPFHFIKEDKTKEIKSSLDDFTTYKPQILDGLSVSRKKYLDLITEICEK